MQGFILGPAEGDKLLSHVIKVAQPTVDARLSLANECSEPRVRS